MSVFDFKYTLKRIICELNNIIEETLTPKTNYEKSRQKKKAPKSDFLNNASIMSKFPFTRETYYTYSSYIDAPKRARQISDMRISSLYKVCQYTDVSADYYLGFNDIKRKEPSAERVKRDFGLSDKAMKRLAEIKNSTPEFKGDISSDIVNAILENDLFWSKLRDYLPICVSCMNEVRAADEDVDIARFGLNRVFNELIDELCIVADGADLPNVELDDTDVVYRKTAE